MNRRIHLTAVAAGAALLASLPLSGLFDRWTWLLDSTVVVAGAGGAALVTRALRAPAWVSAPAAVLGWLITLCWLFPSGHEFARIVAVPATFAHWADLMGTAGVQVHELTVPVDDHAGLLFLTAFGVGAVAVMVDLFAVVLRRPALAGLPMLAIYSVPVAVQVDSVSVVPFAAGAVGFLWLLVTDNIDRMRQFGRRFTADGRDVDLWEPSPVAAAGRRLAAMAVLLAVGVPLALPGMTSGLLDRFGTSGGLSAGVGRGNTSVNLYAQLRGILNQETPYEMVRVTTTDPDPFYLRFGVAEDATEAGFRSHPPAAGTPVNGGLPNPPGPVPDGVTQSPFHAKVQVVNLDMNLLPVYLEPTRTERVDQSWLYDRAGHTIYSTRSSSRKKTYSFDYVRSEFAAAALRSAQPAVRDQFTQARTGLPRQYDEVTAVVAPLVAGKTNEYDKVMAILGYFSAQNGFSYSLQTGTATSDSPIIDFLRSRKGFCEQYSAAMAWLVRSAGIPARVAFGFTRGTPVTGDTYSLTNKNLHAWTEVYFDRFGWVPFDPTPGVAVPGSVTPAWQRTQGQPVGTGNSSAAPGRGQAPGSAAPGGASRPADDPNPLSGPANVATPSPLTGWRFWTLIAVTGVVVLLLAPSLWRTLLRRRRWPDTPATAEATPPSDRTTGTEQSIEVHGAHRRGRTISTDHPTDADARRRAHAAWDELIDTMIDHRLQLDAAATPRVVAEQLTAQAQLTSTAIAGARLLGQAEERARYAREPLRGEELGAALRSVRRAIPRRLSRRTRLVAIIMPPSVLRNWRAAATQGAIAMGARTARRSQRSVRLTPQRGQQKSASVWHRR